MAPSFVMCEHQSDAVLGRPFLSNATSNAFSNALCFPDKISAFEMDTEYHDIIISPLIIGAKDKTPNSEAQARAKAATPL